MKYLLLGICILSLSLSVAKAASIEWKDPVSGNFNSSANWNPTTVPGAADDVMFNEAGSYDVVFTQSEFSQEIQVDVGGVSFFSNNSNKRTYAISADGDDPDVDFDVGGTSTLVVGDDTRPMVVSGEDAILAVGTTSSSSVASLFVVGDESAITLLGTSRVHSIGGRGGMGTLGIRSNALADLGGTLDVGVSNFNDTEGVLNMEGGGQLQVSNLAIATNTTAASGSATITGTGTQATISDTLTIGSASGGSGVLDIKSGGGFTTGIGTTAINATGTVNIDTDGIFNSNGPLMVDGGTISDNFGGGTFSLGPNVTLEASNSALLRINDLDVNQGAQVTIGSAARFLASVDSGNLHVGNGSLGTVNVDGNGSILDNKRVRIGTGGGQGSVTFQNSADGQWGSLGSGDVSLAVDDTDASQGELNILSGSDLLIVGDLSLATSATVGTSAAIVVDGAGSKLRSVAGSYKIGHSINGVATIDISNGGEYEFANSELSIRGTGIVNVGLVGAGTLDSSDGILVDGGQLRFGNLGVLDLAANDTVTAQNGGVIEMAANFTVANGATFNINSNASFTSQANIQVDDGNIIIDSGGSFIASTIDHNSAGEIELLGGTLTATTYNFLSGSVLELTGGNFVTDVFNGDLTNQGATVSAAQVNGNFDNQSGTLAPGSSAGPTNITGDLTLQTAGVISLEIGGTSPGGTHDIVVVAGAANIDGDLELALIDEFLPDPSDTFTVFSANSLSGFLDNIFTGQRLDTIDGSGSFVVNYGIGSNFDPTQIVLSDFEASTNPDLDDDGDVDGADFLVWQREDGTQGGLAAWQATYGAGIGSLQAATTVPEPNGTLLITMGCLLNRRFRSRK